MRSGIRIRIRGRVLGSGKYLRGHSVDPSCRCGDLIRDMTVFSLVIYILSIYKYDDMNTHSYTNSRRISSA